MATDAFWRTKSLFEMSDGEWESLCDGCGQCCLVRLEDEVTGEIIPTHVACRLLDNQTCRCRSYGNRHDIVPDCVKLTPANLWEISWMPPSCAYRRIYEGKDLPSWHPLVTGKLDSAHTAGVSVRGRTFSEDLLAQPADAMLYAYIDFRGEPDSETRYDAG